MAISVETRPRPGWISLDDRDLKPGNIAIGLSGLPLVLSGCYGNSNTKTSLSETNFAIRINSCKEATDVCQRPRLRDEGARILYYEGSHIDIDARKKAEKLLADAEEQ